MAVSESPTYLRAVVGPKVLSKAPELFNQTIATTLSELFQNARRADATAISVTLDALGTVEKAARMRVSIEDNGSGIDDPQVLLTFGGSGWSNDLDFAENAAGMGFYSLASVGAEVESNSWRVTISPAAFVGHEDVLVRSAHARIGTKVSFTVPVSLRIVEEAVLSESEYLPISVSLNGSRVAQVPFLAGATYIKDVLGVKIGVFSTTQPECYSEVEAKERRLNFFGHSISADLFGVTECDPRRGDAGRTRWYARVDVVDAPDLKLVLPTRDSIIKNDAFACIQAATRRAVYEAIAREPDHRLAYTHYAEAIADNVPMPLPRALPFTQWSVESQTHELYSGPAKALFLDTSKAPSPDLMFFPNDECAFGEVALAIALSRAPETTPALLAIEQSYAGYPNIARIPVASCYFQVTGNGKTIELAAGFGDDQATGRIIEEMTTDPWALVDSIFACITLNGKTVATLPVPALVYDNDFGRGTDSRALIVRTASASDICTNIMEQSWQEWDDDHSDAFELAERDAMNGVRALLLPAEDARVIEIAEAFWSDYILRAGLMRSTEPDGTAIRSIAVENDGEKFGLRVQFMNGQERTHFF